MPVAANQATSLNQSAPLPLERVQSSIPKGGTDSETWLYPSPQMVCVFKIWLLSVVNFSVSFHAVLECFGSERED